MGEEDILTSPTAYTLFGLSYTQWTPTCINSSCVNSFNQSAYRLYLLKLPIYCGKLKQWYSFFPSTFMCSLVFCKDLMLFYEDDPKPLLPTNPPAIISSPTWLSEGQAEDCNLWNIGTLVKEQEVYSET